MTASVHPLAPVGLPSEPQIESISARVRRLQAEARTMAYEHIDELAKALEHVHRLAAEISEGGDAYPVGVREMSRRLVEDSEARSQAIYAMIARTPH